MFMTPLTNSQVEAYSTNGGNQASAADPEVSQDRFLKLLVAQLKNQDPMNPLDNAQMTSQMAQINTVTGIQQVNATLQSMAQQFASLQAMQSHALVGRDVLIEGSTLIGQGGRAGGAVDLKGKADAVKVEILSPNGQVLDTFNLGKLEEGRHTFGWDTSTYQGSGHPSFRVTASLGGQAVETTPLALARVVSVSNESGSVKINMQGRDSAAYDSIKAVY